MTLLSFSSNDSEIRSAAKNLVAAGIPCEIRTGPLPHGMFPHHFETELWIQNDGDCYRALMLCAELGIGFAKRVIKAAELASKD
jgi:hypothetical protein